MVFVVTRLLTAVAVAFLSGKLVSKIKLPGILGWLLTGMLLGPYALSLISYEILDAQWYRSGMHVLECATGLMLGTELVWRKLKQTGKAIVITTFFESFITFFLVTLVFGVIFYFMQIPVYLSVLFGGIALATAPAPAISIVKDFKARGPVTDMLLPLTALDTVLACVVFFSIIALTAGFLSAGELPLSIVVMIIVMPLVIGGTVGFMAGLVLKRNITVGIKMVCLVTGILAATVAGVVCNDKVMSKPLINFTLIGMSFSAVFSNMISKEQLEQIMKRFDPILGVAMIAVILNLGLPLDYHLVLGGGSFTAIYILTRGIGKYFGTYTGAQVAGVSRTVRKYLGLTLLPHSGISLVFTGIAVSVVHASNPECARIIQGTIASAAIINELIAVVIAGKSFKWAGEIAQWGEKKNKKPAVSVPHSR